TRGRLGRPRLGRARDASPDALRPQVPHRAPHAAPPGRCRQRSRRDDRQGDRRRDHGAMRAVLRGAAADTLYLLVKAPLALAGFGYALVSAVLGGILSVTRLGGPATAAVLRGARRFGALHRRLAAVLPDDHVPAPGRPRPRAGLRARDRGGRDGGGRRGILHSLAVRPAALLGITTVLRTSAHGFMLLTYPLQWSFGHNEVRARDSAAGRRYGMSDGGFYFDTWQ